MEQNSQLKYKYTLYIYVQNGLNKVLIKKEGIDGLDFELERFSEYQVYSKESYLVFQIEEN